MTPGVSTMSMTSPAHTARLNRLSFRAWRRGFREADLILGPFADSRLASMSDAELTEFERLLEVPDQDLFPWLIRREPCPPEWQGPVMDAIQAFAIEAHAATHPDVRGS
ncbi:MAG: succinate dehydrogenase assembly factor 2 [Caulobacteraceae bacterium]|nr:succinate dehydrogenase assembly factor 2 [Caulobacteraceae bacterium]